MSKYIQIATHIKDDITKGIYKPSNKLKTEEAYTTQFNVSRSTIRKAIALLVKQGYVYQIQGSGVFIRQVIDNDYINLETIGGVTKDFEGKTVETIVIDFKRIEADSFLANKMQCNINDPIYFVKRLRKINGHTFSLEYSHFLKAQIPYLDENIVAKSIYTYIQEDLNLTIGFSDRIIFADILSNEDAKILELPANSPALLTENTIYLNNGKIFDYSKVVHNYQQVKLLKLSNYT